MFRTKPYHILLLAMFCFGSLCFYTLWWWSKLDVNLDFKLEIFVESFYNSICVFWKFSLPICVQFFCSSFPSSCTIGYNLSIKLIVKVWYMKAWWSLSYFLSCESLVLNNVESFGPLQFALQKIIMCFSF